MAVGRVIGRIFLFVIGGIGWIFFIAGLVVLFLRDLWGLVATGHWWPVSLGQLWQDLNPSSLNLVQVTVQHIDPRLWDPVIRIALSWCWASAVLIVLGWVILRSSARGLTLRTASARNGPAGLSSRRGPASGLAASRAWSGPDSLRPSAPGGATSGQRSTVETPYIRMHLDHETLVSGRVVRGAFAGDRIEELDLAGLLAVRRECVAERDERGAQLIEKYLDGVTPDWRDELYRRRASAAPPASTADMTVEEAYDVLGLQPDADEAAVRKAHRRLIKHLHTDQGGTDYLASKINRARDVLLRQIAGQAR